jgi:hypothetical protein
MNESENHNVHVYVRHQENKLVVCHLIQTTLDLKPSGLFISGLFVATHTQQLLEPGKR